MSVFVNESFLPKRTSGMTAGLNNSEQVISSLCILFSHVYIKNKTASLGAIVTFKYIYKYSEKIHCKLESYVIFLLLMLIQQLKTA